MILFDGMFVCGDLQPQPEYGNKTCLGYIYELSKQNKFDRFVLVQNGSITNVPDGIKNVIVSDNSPVSIITVIDDNARNCDEIVVFDAASPFYDAAFTESMLARHAKYMADWTYALGYPIGMTPIVAARKIIPNLLQLAKEANDSTPHRDYLFWALSKDINSFDIETFLSEHDLRTMRLSFGQTDYQTESLAAKVFAATKDMTTQGRADYLAQHPELAYCGPYMVGWDITDRQNVACDYLPHLDRTGSTDLDISIYNKVLTHFAGIADYKMTFLFAGLGEPLLHSQIIEMVRIAAERGIDIVIETNGVGTETAAAIDKLIALPNEIKSHITMVIKLDAYNAETYNKLHQGGDFAAALAAFDKLTAADIRTYKLVTRLPENEKEIEQYIRSGETDHLIIRKYSSYCGSLPDRRVVDLSPFERCPCFHLRREISVDCSGRVRRCPYNDEIIGDLHSDSVESIIDKMHRLFEQNAVGELSDCCQKCDDYYVFNF
jgi:spiro-SPASM protein